MLPRIGLTCCIDDFQGLTGRVSQRLRLNMPYIDAVLAAGGLPLPLAPTLDADRLARQVDGLDGLIVTGGPDVPPALYGQKPHPRTVPVCDRKAGYDIAIFREADRRGLPILGICLGCQVINVARGGTLIQHLDDLALAPTICHADGRGYPRHEVRIARGSMLSGILPNGHVLANSSHHQAIDRLGCGLEASAWAPDGVIEAVEDRNHPFLLALQWHPEAIADEPDHAALFGALIEAARNR